MITKEIIQILIDEATKLVEKYGDDIKSTVAAAGLTEDGAIITSLNYFHFTGGPCAEIALLARLASEGENNVKLIVAVGDRSRGVIAPCGKCRQVMIDDHPSIKVVIPDEKRIRVASVKDLLPGAYIRSHN